MTDIPALNTRFGRAGEIEFREGPGGLPVIEIENAAAAASVVVQGAHLIAWTPKGGDPVIWLSPEARFARGRSIRGGVPVCWPWFGPHSREPSFPSHGFARTLTWAITAIETSSQDATRLVFRLLPNETTRAYWPHATPVELAITVGAALEIALVTRNIGPTPVVIGAALHSYFAVGDVRRILIQGLDGRPYVDKTDGGQRKLQPGPVRIEGETDRIYLNSDGDCLIDDPSFSRRIRIAKSGSQSTVVWNPWREKAAQLGDLGADGYLGMICVESANADEDVVNLMPGAEHRLASRYSVEALAKN